MIQVMLCLNKYFAEFKNKIYTVSNFSNIFAFPKIMDDLWKLPDKVVDL